MSEWQPIETAPKDRTEVIVAQPDEDEPSGWLVKEAWYVEHEDSWFCYFCALEPTHWMPLPEPPGTD